MEIHVVLQLAPVFFICQEVVYGIGRYEHPCFASGIVLSLSYYMY